MGKKTTKRERRTLTMIGLAISLVVLFGSIVSVAVNAASRDTRQDVRLETVEKIQAVQTKNDAKMLEHVHAVDKKQGQILTAQQAIVDQVGEIKQAIRDLKLR